MQPGPASVIDTLPENAILVHLGPHKTGTTAIQSTLAQSRTVLAEHGVLYPGHRISHHHAARSLIQHQQGWDQDGEEPPPPAVWKRFARRLRNHPGRVVISSEFLAEADDAARAALVDDLGSDRVHLVAGARNPAPIAVSTWQQVIRTFGRSTDFETWMEQTFRRDVTAEATNKFWRRVDTTALVTRFLDVVPPERITVVALDEGDRRLLPATFEQLLGLPDGLLIDNGTSRTNRGLTAVELTLIRRINGLLKRRLSWAEYTLMMRSGVIPRILTKRTPGPDEAKEPVPGWALEQALEEVERNIAGLQRTGVRIAGDLASLRKVPAQSELAAPITEVPLDLAAEAVVGAVLAGTRHARTLDKAKRRAASKTPSGDTSSAEAPPTQTPPAQTPPTNTPPTKTPPAKTVPARPAVDDLRTQELAAVLAHRVRARVRRTIERPGR